MKGECVWKSLPCVFICYLYTGVLTQDSLSPGPVVYVINGSNATFTCSTTKSWNYIYVFDHGIKDSNLARVIFQRNSTHCKPWYIDTEFGAGKYSGLPCSVSQPVSFVVRYITAKYHNKSISCKVDSGQLIRTTVKIREQITSPKINPDGILTIEEGASVDFKCTATSIPQSSIEWYVSGSKLTGAVKTSSSAENNMISTITYLARREHYNMKLLCTADDSFTAMNSSLTNLNILYVPTAHIEPVYDPYIVYAGQKNVLLTCVVDDGNPSDDITFHWTIVGGTATNSTVAITTVSSGDGGQYTCMAVNRVGNSSVSFKLLKVQYAPRISNNVSNQDVIEGKNLIVSPTIVSDPVTDEIWWTKQADMNFRYDGSVLKINRIHRTANGNYTCNVMNNLTPSGRIAINMTTQKTFYINVQYVPTAHIEPVYDPYIVYAGQKNVLLTCVVDDGNPSDDITFHWTIVGGTANNNTVDIPAVTKKDNGQYTCIAESIVGNSSVIFKQLNVQYGPLISTILNRDITEGNNLLVSPVVDAYPGAALVWWTTHNDTKFRYDGAVLTINKIQRTLSGYYTCYVMNTLTPSGMSAINRTTWKNFYVNVQFKPSLDTTKPFSSSHISVTENSTLVLTVTINGNPTPAIEWIFKGQAFLNLCNFSTILSDTTTNGFLTSSSISLTSVKSSNFGEYTLIAKSTIGTFFRRFVVYEGGETMPPLLVYVVCKNTSATVIWNHIFNGGSSFEFYLQYAEKGQYVTSEKLHLNSTIQPMIYTVTALAPNRTYSFSILAVNLLAEFKSQTLECVTDASPLKQEMCELTNEYTGMFVAGITTLTVGLLSLSAAVFCVVRNSLKKKTCESSKTDEYTDVQRDNPVFVTDAYSTLQVDVASRPFQEQSEVNTYEECNKKPETHAYSTLDITTGQNDSRKKQGVYDNLKI